MAKCGLALYGQPFQACNKEIIVVLHRLVMLPATDGYNNGIMSGHNDIKGQIRNHKGYMFLNDTNAINVPAIRQ